MAAICFAASLLVAIAGNGDSMEWVRDSSATNRWAVEVTVADVRALAGLAKWNESEWRELLEVRAEHGGDLFTEVGLPAMAGNYAVARNRIRFTPHFPLEPGLGYRATFRPEKLPGVHERAKPLTAAFQVPPRVKSKAAVVTQIYPTADVLPENLLKFYIHFSAPMSRGHIYDHIHLRNASGRDVQLPFLEIDEELWNPELTRLTLFIDPGRIKRGVTPLEEIGPALEQGKSFTLEIDKDWLDATGVPLKEGFRKSFQVGPADRQPIDPATWKIQPPSAGTRAPLTIIFPKPIDHALAKRVINVMNAASQLIPGECVLSEQERRWEFTPENPWRSGTHALLVQRTIEDLAGNNIGKAFEVDLFDGVQRRFTNETVRLPFEVR